MHRDKTNCPLPPSRPRIDAYFLEERCPYSGKRKVKTRNLKVLATCVGSAGLLAVLFLGNDAENRSQTEGVPQLTTDALPSQTSNLSRTLSEGSIGLGSGWLKQNGGIPHTKPGRAAAQASSPRQRTASQIVRGAGGASGTGLPMGTVVGAKLLNTLLSTDSGQPVIAGLAEDAVWQNSVLIPVGTKAIGRASFDETTQRLQIQFHTLVYPEGDQHPVQASALLEDGSSGIPGNYHSGTAKKQLGQALGSFISGLAEGMKDRESGQFGITFQPGSLRNGVLNGVTQSALDQGKAVSEEIRNSKAYLEVPGGSAFFLYFEKEYSP